MLYLAIRGAKPGPLFIIADRKHLTRQIFNSNLNVQQMQIDTSKYHSHSFRIAVATSAKDSDVHIQMFGRWRTQIATSCTLQAAGDGHRTVTLAS